MKKIIVLFFALFLFKAKAEESKKVSVIIPAYNVEKYIEQAVDSVVNQTYKNLEIIIIEDISTDNTYEILKKLALKEERIKLYRSEKNSGVSGTRNKGIDEATGEYLMFLDSDDWLDLRYIEKMVDAMNKLEVDFVVNKKINTAFDFKKSRKDRFVTVSPARQSVGVHGIKNSYRMSVVVWDKLYKSSMIKNNQLYFPEELRTAEDTYFTNIVMANTNRFAVIKGDGYNYRIRENSLMDKNGLRKGKGNSKEYIKSLGLTFDYFRKNPTKNIRFTRLTYAILRPVVSQDKEKTYKDMRDFLLKNRDIIDNNRENYANNELVVFENMIKYEDYKSFSKHNKSRNLKLYMSLFVVIVIFIFIITMTLRAFYLIVKKSINLKYVNVNQK